MSVGGRLSSLTSIDRQILRTARYLQLWFVVARCRGDIDSRPTRLQFIVQPKSPSAFKLVSVDALMLIYVAYLLNRHELGTQFASTS